MAMPSTAYLSAVKKSFAAIRDSSLCVNVRFYRVRGSDEITFPDISIILRLLAY